MSFLRSTKNPHDVFTPRSATVNPSMYVARPDLESALTDGLRGTLHLVVHGESGCGKSWLYKKVLADLGIHSVVANLANASRLGGLAAELTSLLDREETAVQTGYSEVKESAISAVVASGGLSHESEYKIARPEPFERFLQFAKKRSKGKEPPVLVLDNLEAAWNNKALLKELADVLILLDDERYAQYGVRTIVVGVPGDLREYYARTPTLGTVANRLREIPEVSRLSKEQVHQLVVLAKNLAAERNGC